MNAGLGWIDFSTEHRDKVYSVVDMLSESGTVDELGVGPIRDAIADWLFPGVSTIQTRPKYFILIPQLLLKYLNIYSKSSKPPLLSEYLRDEEIKLMRLLANNYKFIEGNGVIGVDIAKRGGELARKPSSIYWNGIRTHGFIKTHLSLNEYLKLNDLNNYHGDSSDEDGDFNLENKFNITTPPFLTILDDVDLELNLDEASFLRDHFINSDIHKQENNLLSYLLLNKDNMALIIKSSNFNEFAYNLMQHSDIPNESKQVLHTALYFNFLIHGAHIRYNILLHHKSGSKDFTSEWNAWEDELNRDKDALSTLDLDFLFNSLAKKTPYLTQMFIRNLKLEFLKTTINTAILDTLIINQERNKKGMRSKLGTTPNSEEFDNWVGIREIEYRFKQVKTLITDIHRAYA